jgi:two-component system, NtrC family, sensor kinase
VIGHPRPGSIAFGADFAPDYDSARKALKEFSYPVIALPSSPSRTKDALALLEFANTTSPHSQRVIIQNDTAPEDLRKLINTGSVFRILPSFDDLKFELTIQEALDEYRLLRQNSKLLQLVNEQNDRLKKLTSDLEERVEARRKSLEEAKERLLVTNDRVEALHRALVAIHRAGSIGEMERLINEALTGALGLTWTRVLFQSQARLESQGALTLIVSLHAVPLVRGKDVLGHLYFARGVDAPFTRDETGFLSQVGDAVALAIDRLSKLEQSESLKAQWEATFDAIREPVSVMSHDFTLLRINRSYAERSGTTPEKVIGRKCYEALFGRTTTCEGCAIAEGNFRLKPMKTSGHAVGADANVIYDVFSQEVHLKSSDQGIYVNVYHDMSPQLRYERQIVESAKMAELGTIGSSIAHELNNPLGGMLSFLQLIKMDLGDNTDVTETWKDDINEMELGARRCRDIVQSLLGFTRKSSVDTVEQIDLREVVEQALNITELQTRAMGITVKQNLGEEPAIVRGQFNSLAQSIRHFLQNAQEAINERIRSGDRTNGIIEVLLKTDRGGTFEVEIKDNGAGFDNYVGDQIYDPLYTTKNPESNPGLGLTVAQQIVKDHGGVVEMNSIKGTGTTAKISLPPSKTDSVTEPVTSSF